MGHFDFSLGLSDLGNHSLKSLSDLENRAKNGIRESESCGGTPRQRVWESPQVRYDRSDCTNISSSTLEQYAMAAGTCGALTEL